MEVTGTEKVVAGEVNLGRGEAERDEHLTLQWINKPTANRILRYELLILTAWKRYI